jgi:hypothetical protein
MIGQGSVMLGGLAIMMHDVDAGGRVSIECSRSKINLPLPREV